jgi:hypothetical protein
VEVVGAGWVACMPTWVKAFASTIVDEGYRLPAKARPVLLFSCQCDVFLLQHVGSLPAFW